MGAQRPPWNKAMILFDVLFLRHSSSENGHKSLRAPFSTPRMATRAHAINRVTTTQRRSGISSLRRHRRSRLRDGLSRRTARAACPPTTKRIVRRCQIWKSRTRTSKRVENGRGERKRRKGDPLVVPLPLSQSLGMISGREKKRVRGRTEKEKRMKKEVRKRNKPASRCVYSHIVGREGAEYMTEVSAWYYAIPEGAINNPSIRPPPPVLRAPKL